MSAQCPWEGQEGCVWGVVTPGLLLGSGQKASVTSLLLVSCTRSRLSTPACLYTKT